MSEWVDHFSLHFGWIAVASILFFFISIFLVSYFTVRIPADYFLTKHKAIDRWKGLPLPVRWLIFLTQQLLGVFLILAGILMLVLPGQGVLTIFIGVMLTSFPGKPRLVRWLVGRPSVLRTINWMRRRADRAPLVLKQ